MVREKLLCKPMNYKDLLYAVAPRAGAWIETAGLGGAAVFWLVAPRAGAWIETVICVRRLAGVVCRPPRGGVD